MSVTQRIFEDDLKKPQPSEIDSDTESKKKPQPAGAHIGELDGIRGFATILVLAYHYGSSVTNEFGWVNPLTRLIRVGWIGVDLFFVLSGYLITGILLKTKGTDGYLKNFYARRSLRIFPLYYSALICFSLLVWAFPLPSIRPQEPLVWLWIYATNIVQSLPGARGFGALDHFWSLAVEEHFYLIWPFVVLVCSRAQLVSVAVLTLVFSPLVRLALVTWNPNPAAPYFLTPGRVDALAIGALLTLLSQKYGLSRLATPARVLTIASAFVFGLILVARKSLKHDDPWIAVLGLSAVTSMCGGVIAWARNPGFLQDFFNWRLLRFFGKYSYGLYVWHPILFILFLHSEPVRAWRGPPTLLNAWLSILGTVVSTAIVTGLSWHFVESRFLRLKSHFH